jgi:hypothetical protein
MLQAISILLAMLAGFLLVQAFDPVRDMRPRWAAILFDAALGTGVGIGLASIIFLLLDVAGLASPAAIFGIDIALVGVLGWQWYRTRAGGATRAIAETTPGFRWTWLLAVAFGIALAVVCTRLFQMAAALPVGDWDAWTLWNLRAKFLAGPGGSWRYAVSPLIDATHPDYPLLLSAFVARAWKAGGSVDAMAPIATAFVFFAALLALLVSAVALLRGAASALLAGLVLLSTTSLLGWAPAQYADIPLAFYYLGALVLIFLEAAPAADGRRALLWAGLCVGLAPWTKNEGVAFLACFSIVFFAATLWKVGVRGTLLRAGWLAIGVVPGALATLWLKFFLAPAVDPLVTQGVSGFARLHDLSRYAQVASGLFNNLLTLGSGVGHPLILLAILAVLVRLQIEDRYKLPELIAGAGLVVVFLSYCLVLVATPYGIAWEVQTSFDRLILHFWPSALLVFFVMLRGVVDAETPAGAIKKTATRKSPKRQLSAR